MICPTGKSMSFHKKETEKIDLVARPDMNLHVRHFQHLKLRETTTIRKVIAQNVQHTREITTSTRRNRQPIVWLPNYFNILAREGRQATLLHDLTRRRCWTKLKIIFQSLILYFCCRFCGCLQVTSNPLNQSSQMIP